MPFNFYELYNLLNENIEENFDKWLEIVFQYTKKNTTAGDVLTNIPGVPVRDNLIGTDPKNWQDSERAQLKYIIDRPQEIYIKQVLKEKNIENLNWFNFCIGYLSAKRGFYKEDLELAIEVTKNRIASRELPKNEIGSKGWLVVGFESLEHVRDYLRKQQETSNRQKLKLRKKGETLEEDESLIKLLDQKNNFKLYFLPSIATGKDNKYHDDWSAAEYVNKRESRKRLLCKYGKDTDWCTANPTGGYHEYYVDQDIYILHENDKPKYQFTGCHRGLIPQFMNIKDEPVELISQKDMEFLHIHLGDCHKNIKFTLKSPEEYLKSKIKERISLESILDLCLNEDTPPEVLKDIHLRYNKEIEKTSVGFRDHMNHNSDRRAVDHIQQSLCKNPNTPQEILTEIYETAKNMHLEKKYYNIKFIKTLVENPNTPIKILEEISELINEFLDSPADSVFAGKPYRSTWPEEKHSHFLIALGTSEVSLLAIGLAKNKNSNIFVLNNLLKTLKSIENHDYQSRLGVEILRNSNSKKDPKFVEEILKIIKKIINSPKTYHFTLIFLSKILDLPDELATDLNKALSKAAEREPVV